jgi:hypothetical protein
MANEKLRELIARWRDKAVRWSLAGPTVNGQTVDALRYCADELVALLAVPAAGEPPVEGKQGEATPGEDAWLDELEETIQYGVSRERRRNAMRTILRAYRANLLTAHAQSRASVLEEAQVLDALIMANGGGPESFAYVNWKEATELLNRALADAPATGKEEGGR